MNVLEVHCTGAQTRLKLPPGSLNYHLRCLKCLQKTSLTCLSLICGTDSQTTITAIKLPLEMPKMPSESLVKYVSLGTKMFSNVTPCLSHVFSQLGPGSIHSTSTAASVFLAYVN